MNYYTISELSRISGIPVSTLRFYQRKKIFLPILRNEENGYQYYSSEQTQLLSALTLLREMNISIGEIQDFLEHPRSREDVCTFLNAQRTNLLNEITKLSNSAIKISEILKAYGNTDPEVLPEGVVKTRKYTHRYIMHREISLNNMDTQDWLLKILGTEIGSPDERPNALMSMGVTCRMKEGSLGDGNYSGIFIEPLTHEKENVSHSIIYDDKTFLVIRFADTDGKRKKAYDTLLSYIKKEKLDTEDIIYELIIDSWFPNVWSKFQTLELQVCLK